MPISSGRKKVDLVVVLAAGLVGGVLAALAIMRYRAYNAGMSDLGHMVQSIWSAAHGRPLEFTYHGSTYSRLALHVELIYFLLAPIYALIPKPETLLILQAALFASGALPVYGLAVRKTGSIWAARLLVLTYLFYPVAQTAVLFDIHGDTLAMPLLLYAIDAWDSRRWPRYIVFLVLALACKFYVALVVVALAFLVLLRGDRHPGILTLMGGASWGLIAFLLVRPHFAPTIDVPVQATGVGYLSFYFGNAGMATQLSSLPSRLVTALIVFGPALWLGRYALRWFLPALVTALPALLVAGDVNTFDYRFHHYALSVPFLMAAAVFGAEVLWSRRSNHPAGDQRQLPRGPILDVGMHAAITLLFACLLVDMPLNPLFWARVPTWGLDSLAYGRTRRDALKDTWLSRVVPPQASLGASYFLAPHLANRATLLRIAYPGGVDSAEIADYLAPADHVVVDALFDYTSPSQSYFDRQRGVPFLQRSKIGMGHPAPVVGGVAFDHPAIGWLLRSPDWVLAGSRDGLLLFVRSVTLGVSPLHHEIEVMGRAGDGIRLDLSAGPVGLVSSHIEEEGSGRYRLVCEWTALEPLGERPAYIAVSRLEGIDNARVVHLPTAVLYPTTEWQADEVVRESIDFNVSPETPPGHYRLLVGWYDEQNLYAAATDARSRVGEELVLGSVLVR